MADREPPGYDDWFDDPEPPTVESGRGNRPSYDIPGETEEDVWVLPEDEARQARRARQGGNIVLGGRSLTTTQVAILAIAGLAVLIAILAAAGVFSSNRASTVPTNTTPTTLSTNTTTTPTTPTITAPTQQLKEGDTGAQVTLLQKELKSLDSMDGPHFKLACDPRVTRVGRILRALNVDELPQLVNVLTGDMSLVGPRPSPFRENQVCVPWREARLSVRPGITGLWQVCRHDRASGDFHQWIEYDLLYVQNVSIWLDLKILVATIVTLGGKKPVRASWLIGQTANTPALGDAGAHAAPAEQVAM